MADRNRYVFEATLEGFINVYEDEGKFNNRCFSFKLPKDVIEAAEADREELLEWAKSKAPNPRRCEVALSKWDDEGLVKYSYSEEKPKAIPVFVDTEGSLIDKAVLKDVRKGTKVKLIVQQGPYVFGNKVGTRLLVKGVQIIELASGNGSVDSGDMSAEDVAAIFGTTSGFKQSDPQVRKAAEAEPETTESYDF
ncbi:ssDNA binding protein [Synechococcus phage P60]|uniref:SsDNA binding protein n=1 Tax=Synechococcus phage P60 TaxID=2905923 RepID=L0CPZ5_9CAUD|nr:ssDNA binding protein [Synechococcus phage P60]AGA17879.1 ssDNA binding protein [Synechococcus phage P60]